MKKEAVAELQPICDKIRARFDAKDAAREKAFARSREIVRNSANAIRAVHRGEFEDAMALMGQSAALIAEIEEALQDQPDIYYAGYVQDAQKEHAEAHQTYALIRGEPLPDPDDLKVCYAPYMNALGEAIGELRRHALDGIRHNELGWGEGILTAMDEIYYAMVSFDYPAAISGGLKRTADVTRSLIERTRGDVTNATRQQRLENALAEIETRLQAQEGK
jgi:translin